MGNLIDILMGLNSKERYWLLWNAIGDDRVSNRTSNPASLFESPERFSLTDKFRDRLGEEIGMDIPANSFWAMDYHLDWLWAAKNAGDGKCPVEGYKGNQQDIDLLVVFNSTCGSDVHMILIEVKGVTSWGNKQVDSKIRRLRDLFGDDGRKWAGVVPHFVLMSPSESYNIKVEDWPAWAVSKDSATSEKRPRYWLGLNIPLNLKKATRCDEGGNSNAKGEFVVMCCRRKQRYYDGCSCATCRIPVTDQG